MTGISAATTAPPAWTSLTTGRILPTLLRLSLPNTVAMSATVLVSIAETAYIGRLGTVALAGIAVVFPIIVLQQSFSNGAMGGGVSSAISRALGAQDEQRARALALHATIIGIVAGLISGVGMLVLGPALYRLLGASGEALEQALAYSNLAFCGSLAVWLTAMFISIVRGGGNMRLPSATTLALLLAQAALGAVLGLGLGPFPRLGMTGVASALVAAYAGAAVFLFCHLRSKRARVPLILSGIPLRRELFGEILGVGLLTCISPLQTILTVLIVTALVSHLGTDVLAGYGIGARLETVLVPIAFGIGVACVPMVGMAIGAGNVTRARRVAATGAALSALALGLIGAIVVVAPQLWADIFTDNARSLDVAGAYLVWSGPAYAFFGLGLCLLFASQGAGKVLGPVLAGTSRLVVMAIGGWWLARTSAPLWAYFALVAAGMAVYGVFAATAVYLSDWRPKARSATTPAKEKMPMMRKIAPHLLRILPDALGYRLLLSLIGATQAVPLSEPEQRAMSTARPLRFGADGGNTAWEWGDGPLVVLVHGWGGRAAQMAPLAASLAARGYRCVAPDITGHGDAEKRYTRWRYFLRDIEALTRSLASDVFAFVGHSAGGMTMMAVRRHGLIDAQRYVCICAPSYPFPPVDRVKQLLNPSDGVMARYKDYLGGEFDIPWRDLERGESYAAAGADLLLIYDERDRFVPHGEGDRIHALCPGSSLIKTRDYSHQRILTAPELPDYVARFLASHQRGAGMPDRASSAR